jgi:hypothetical protein
MKGRRSSRTGRTVLHGLLRVGESILLNKYEMIFSHVVNLKIGGGPGTFFTPCVPFGRCIPIATIVSRFSEFRRDVKSQWLRWNDRTDRRGIAHSEINLKSFCRKVLFPG